MLIFAFYVTQNNNQGLKPYVVHAQVYLFQSANTYTPTLRHTNTHKQIHTQTNTFMQIQQLIHTHLLTHTHIHTQIHTHTHSHNHTHTSEEGRESETKDCTDVSLNWTVQDVVLETPDCLVHKPRHQTNLNLLLIMASLVGGGGRKTRKNNTLSQSLVYRITLHTT